jgi:hypothetical protein
MSDLNDTIFSEDFKLKHVVIPDIWYIDEDIDEAFPAKLELFGHSREITYIEGKYTTTKRGSILRGPQYSKELTYQIIKSDRTTITLDLGVYTYVRLSWANFKLLKAYYDEQNIVYIQAERAFKDKIFSMLPKLFDDSELLQMVSNFVEEVPMVLYLDPTFIISTESMIRERLKPSQVRNENKGNSLFLSDELQRSTVLKLEKVTEAISPTEVSIGVVLHFTNEEIIKSYLDNSYFQLVKLMKARFHLDEDIEAVYFTYAFLYKFVIRHFSQKWSTEYIGYFRNIDDLSLSEAIQQYCLIKTINPNDLQTAGTFIYYLIDHGKFVSDNYLSCLDLFVQQMNPILERQKTENFVHKIKQAPSNRAYTINDIDLMSGQEFEQFLAILFSKMGYETEVTKGSGDQGIDVIASKDGTNIGIQAKCYSGSVGNGAIQEAVAGRNYYHLDKAIVVTNSGFTNSAKELAEANSVVLWDRNILKDKITELW